MINRDRRGLRSEAMIHITDWFPTILKLAKYDKYINTDGEDIWSVIKEGNKGTRDTIVYNLDMDDQSGNFQFGIRKENWKLLWGHPEKFAVNRMVKRTSLHIW